MFAPLQSETARRLLAPHGGILTDTDSIVVLENGALHVRSAAALAVVARLNAPWPFVARLARLVPRGLGGRYRRFGHRDVCELAPTNAADRFLDGPPAAP